MTTDEIAARFNAKKSGNGFQAHCPAHEDRNPSLSINEGLNGATLLNCHAGCTLDDILAAIGLTKRDLFRESTSTHGRNNQAVPLPSRLRKQGDRTARKIAPAKFDWGKYIAAFTDKHLEHIAKWRGLSPEFVRELRDKKLIGIFDGLVAFPVVNNGGIVGAHVRMKNGKWFYTPSGIKTAPLVIGKAESGDLVHVFESQFDAFAFMDRTGERSCIICTRGSKNGELVAGLIPESATAILWTQNDELDPNSGRRAGDEWQAKVCEHLFEPTAVKRATIPAHDLNDWVRAGATADDLRAAIEQAKTVRKAAPVSLDDFHAYMPMHNYIFDPTRDFWPAASVDSRLPAIKRGRRTIKASRWLDANRPVEQMTWAPGLPMLIKDRLISDGGWIPRAGCTTFNLYRPPEIEPGDASKAGRWCMHIAALYPKDANHIVRWFAHQVQRPQEKINHALFLGGNQGIGKDTILYPVKRAVGQWNVQEILPPALLGRFNGFVKAVLLCINEVHDLGDLDRYALYERLKAYTAAPPDVIRVDEKNLREYPVFNVCGVLLTSNHKTNGLYLPVDDRRYYVAWSNASKDQFSEKYWREIYAWYDREGCRHVAAHLAQLDISGFNPKSPPPKTEAFWEIVESNRAPEAGELADALASLGNPDVVTKAAVVEKVDLEFSSWLNDRRNARQVPYRFEEVGYIAVRNPGDKTDGRWQIAGKGQVIYAKISLSERDRLVAARKFAEAARL